MLFVMIAGNGVNEFVWFFPRAGHELAPTEAVEAPSGANDDLWIVPRNLSNRSTNRWYRYAPLERNTGLFRTFADVGHKQESVLEFANGYGLLTNIRRGESLATWKTAIDDMRSAVDCWDALKREVPTSADKSLQPPPRVCANAVTLMQGAGATWEGVAAELPSGSLARGTPCEAGADLDVAVGVDIATSTRAPGNNDRESLNRTINRYISKVRPVLTFNFDELLERSKVKLMPANLLEAMWLQFAQAIESDKAFRRCRQCNSWFELSYKAARIERVFCTEACKAKAYRRRLAEQKTLEVAKK